MVRWGRFFWLWVEGVEGAEVFECRGDELAGEDESAADDGPEPALFVGEWHRGLSWGWNISLRVGNGLGGTLIGANW